MTLSGQEGLVDAVSVYLAANLTAKLTALDTEYTDTLVLAPPVTTYVGIKSLKSIPSYPSMFIFSPSSRIGIRQVIAGTTSAFVETKPQLIIGMVEVDIDSETLQRRLYRYGRAFEELILEAQAAFALDGWSIGTDEEWEIDTFATESDSGSSDSVGEVTLTIRANKNEQK